MLLRAANDGVIDAVMIMIMRRIKAERLNDDMKFIISPVKLFSAHFITNLFD